MDDRFDRLLKQVEELVEEVRFQRNFAALAPFAERPHLPYTCGSELHRPHLNPHYRDPDVSIPRQAPRPIGELIGKPARARERRTRPVKRVEPVRYGHVNGRTAQGYIPPKAEE